LSTGKSAISITVSELYAASGKEVWCAVGRRYDSTVSVYVIWVFTASKASNVDLGEHLMVDANINM
jgi:hypothetical protein